MHWSEFAIVALLMFVVVGSLSAWTWFFQGRNSGSSLLPYVERRAVPWGMIDIVVVIFTMFLTQSLGAAATSAFNDAPAGAEAAISPIHMLSFSIASLTTWAFSICFIMTRTGATVADMGCDRPRDQDIRQGVVAFFLLALPVFGVQLILAWLWQESQHPLIQLMENRPETLTFLISAFAAVIVAPLVEEFFFRVIVQGWLENIAALWQLQRGESQVSRSSANDVFLGGMRTVSSTSSLESNDGTTQLDELTNPYDAPKEPLSNSQRVAASADLNVRPATWPIVVSAGLFAVAHFGNGPDPIPLFILALGLGYLYRQTHRIWPCIVVHMMLNSLSMAQLWLYTQSLPPGH